MKKLVYMDNAATTRVRKEVLEELLPFYNDEYGNPSTVYSLAKAPKAALDLARRRVGRLINAKPEEIFFTGSGTESDNWAIIGAARARAAKGRHIITSAIEHHAVLHTCQFLEKSGYEVTYLPVNGAGIVSPEDAAKAVRPDTVLITVMFANNEIGTLQPIREIGAIAREKGILFHTDAVQALGHIPIDVTAMNIDMLSASAHKLYAPKGVGMLYVRKGVKIDNLLNGGAQERGKRPSTENVAGIAAFGKAAELAMGEMDGESNRLAALRDRLTRGLLEIPHTRLNGDPVKRLPSNVNVSFEFIEGEGILLHLDMNGICASSGSACTSGSLDPSHVLLALGLVHEKAHGSIRFSLGMFNTEDDVDAVLAVLPGIVQKLRDMSPLYEEFIKKR